MEFLLILVAINLASIQAILPLQQVHHIPQFWAWIYSQTYRQTFSNPRIMKESYQASAAIS